MDPNQQIIRPSHPLSMSLDKWERWQKTPAWARDRFMAVDHFRAADGTFEIAEALLAEAVPDNTASPEHFISLLIDSRANSPLELDIGGGKFLRPNQPGSIVFGGAGHPHSLKGVGPFHSILMYVHKDVLQDKMSEILGREVPSLEMAHSKTLRDESLEVLMKQLLWTCRQPATFGQSLTTSGLFYGILGRLLTLAELDFQEIQPEDRLRPQAVTKAIEYMREFFTQDLSISDLATVAGVSRCHFSRLFSQTVGKSAKEYLLDLRIEHARTLLVNRELLLPVSEIAGRCGFFDQSHLSREFRRRHGISPGAYRQEHGPKRIV